MNSQELFEMRYAALKNMVDKLGIREKFSARMVASNVKEMGEHDLRFAARASAEELSERASRRPGKEYDDPPEENCACERCTMQD